MAISESELMRALREVQRFNQIGACYWFRDVAMARLAERGLVETWLPPSVAERPRMKRRPWRLTEAGRQLIAAMEQV